MINWKLVTDFDPNISHEFITITYSESEILEQVLKTLGYSLTTDSDDAEPMPQEEYLESGGKFCPVCRSTNITVEDPIDHDTHCNRLYCMTCGQYWNEMFEVKLRGYTLGDG